MILIQLLTNFFLFLLAFLFGRNITKSSLYRILFFVLVLYFYLEFAQFFFYTSCCEEGVDPAGEDGLDSVSPSEKEADELKAYALIIALILGGCLFAYLSGPHFT